MTSSRVELTAWMSNYIPQNIIHVITNPYSDLDASLANGSWNIMEFPALNVLNTLTHWGRVTHICVSKLTIIGSDNGLSPERRQAIIWTNAGILLIGPLGTNFSEILIEIRTFSLKKIRLKMSSAKCCSFRLGLNVLSPDDHFTLETS